MYGCHSILVCQTSIDAQADLGNAKKRKFLALEAQSKWFESFGYSQQNSKLEAP